MTAQQDTPSSTTGATGRRLVALLFLLIALAGIGAATLGAAADRGDGGSYVGEPLREIPPPQKSSDPYSEPDWTVPETQERPPASEGGRTWLYVVGIVLAVVLVLLALWVLVRMHRLATPPPPLAGEADEDELTLAQARAALDEARDRLSTEVDAQGAVIEAWLALERAIGSAGVTRDPAQTTIEFVVAVLGKLALDRSSLERLAHLYRRALFDDTPLQETHRDEALSLLDHLTTALEPAAPRPGGAR